MNVTQFEIEFRRAVDAFQAHDLVSAEKILKKIERSTRNFFDVQRLLGVIMLIQKRFSEAEYHLKAALVLNSHNDEVFSDYGYALMCLNKPHEALSNFTKALSINPRNPLTYQHAGTVFSDYLGNYAEAIKQFDKVITLVPSFPFAYVSKGFCLAALARYNEAFVAYDKALSIEPSLEKAWLGRGNIFLKLSRYDEAVAAYDKALSIKPDLDGAWLGCGNVFYNLKRYDEALAAYDKALSIGPDLEGAWVGRGNALLEFKRYDEAMAAYDKALSIKPDSAEAWVGRGNVFVELKRYNEVMTAYDKALSIKPGSAEAWLGRGNICLEFKRYDEAISAYDKALSVAPDLAEAWLGRGHASFNLKHHDHASIAYDKALLIDPDLETLAGARLNTKMQLCDWTNLDQEIAGLIGAIKDGRLNSTPFALLSLTDSTEDHLRLAQSWAIAKHPASAEPLWQNSVYKHDKIRLGYVSADLHEHATAYLMAELFELHNKERFSVTAFSIGNDDNSDMRRRLVRSFDRFVDCRSLSDFDAARAISESEIDILVDLKGFTKDARTGIFSHRPAPIQVNYLGYPATMGAPYIDYIIGDKMLFTRADAEFFSEKLVLLPDSYQPNDRKRQISTKAFSRQEVGLPDNAFVFCCFNNNYKILPQTFDSWMCILKRVEGSVLWLFAENQTAMANLKNEAGIRGVDPARLVFAGEMELPGHLARHRLADLFLDTLPYNAHTTASDALWAGLPVLTQVGSAFPGRVACSLLNAIGLPELITRSREEYEALASELALNPEKLTAIREKLAMNRLAAPLFDAPLYTKHLEVAYEAMYQRHKAGLPPDHIE